MAVEHLSDSIDDIKQGERDLPEGSKLGAKLRGVHNSVARAYRQIEKDPHYRIAFIEVDGSRKGDMADYELHLLPDDDGVVHEDTYHVTTAVTHLQTTGELPG